MHQSGSHALTLDRVVQAAQQAGGVLHLARRAPLVQARPNVRHMRAQLQRSAAEQGCIALSAIVTVGVDAVVGVGVDLTQQAQLPAAQQGPKSACFCRELKRAGVLQHDAHVAWRDGVEGQNAAVAQGGVHGWGRAARLGMQTR